MSPLSCFLVLLFTSITYVINAQIIHKKCAEIQTYNVSNRQSTVYIPSFMCNTEDYFKFFSIEPQLQHTQHLLAIPIIIALHGFTNIVYDFLTQYTKLTTFAEEYGFIVIAPIGLHHSWNGIYCCGKSVENNINDLQFIKTVIQLSIPFITALFNDIFLNNTRHIPLFITGQSNGGFMSDEIAWAYALGEEGFPIITAFAPYLGYIYDVNDVKLQMNNTIYQHKAIPIFFQHGDSDPFVKVNGCCHKQRCNGNLKIDSFKEECTSLYQEYKRWLDWNHCNEDITFESIAKITSRRFDDKRNIKCATATAIEHGCDEITKLCIFQGNGHDSHIGKNVDEFQTNWILFFYEILCLKYNGIWDIDGNLTYPCICYNKKRALYCMDINIVVTQELETTFQTENSIDEVTVNMSDVYIVSGAVSTEPQSVLFEVDKIKENVETEFVNEEENRFDLMFVFWISVGCIGGLIVKQCWSDISRFVGKDEPFLTQTIIHD